MEKIRFIVLIVIFSLARLVWAGGEGVQANAGNGDPLRGKELYDSDLGCNVCHGPDATGAVGPNIRESITMEKVAHALQNFPDMMNWQFNNPEMFEEQALLDIIAYLQSLPREPE